MALRNSLYDKGVLASEQFDIPVIAVGNLTVGGTGKTPHVEYLLRLLQKYRVATLSRGYKRKTKGFVLADAQASAARLGDEPFQYFCDFKEVTVAVSEDRVAGIRQLREQRPETEVIVLDDAMQHRPVQPSLNILVTDFYRPFFKDFVLPAGLLRERRKGAARADAVIMSKCPPGLSGQEQERLKLEIKKYTKPGTPVFFTAYSYGNPVSVGLQQPVSKQILLLTGIANAAPFKQYLLSEGYTIVQHLAYPDHYFYTEADLQRVQQLVKQHPQSNLSVLTTRKDAVKLASASLSGLVEQLPVFYIPIEVRFLQGAADFDELVLHHVQHGRVR